MGAIYDFEKEKLIVGVIYHDAEVLNIAMERLVAAFGEVEDVSEEFSFSREFSTYYDEEIGGEGLRRIYSFREWQINLDPGFINHGRLMLATTKATGFRIPLADGIYTELTLYWARGAWQKLPWTYRDYQSERVQKFITEVRRKYLAQRKETN